MVETNKLFYSNIYQREFEAEIVAMDQGGLLLALDGSLFYPGGGGQPCDLGIIEIDSEKYNIEEVFSTGGLIWHKLDKAAPGDLVGKGVRASLDWERRYRHMRYHSALHVLNGVAYNAFGALVTGGQVYADRARIDFTLENLAPEKVEFLELETNRAIEKALPLIAREVTQAEAAELPELVRTVNAMPPQSARIRIMEIAGLDRQFCGGTHVNNSSEVGPLKVSGTRSKGKQNKRVEIQL